MRIWMRAIARETGRFGDGSFGAQRVGRLGIVVVVWELNMDWHCGFEVKVIDEGLRSRRKGESLAR